MLDEIAMNRDTYSFEEADQRVEQFERLLRQNGIAIQPNSPLERLCLSVHDVLYKHRVPSSQDPLADIRPWLREVIGMNDLIHKLLRVQHHASFRQMARHLSLLNSGYPLQNIPTSVLDQSSNKIFELLLAAAVMQHGTDVELDDPENSGGDNPDVLATIGAKRWGFACKVAHSGNGKTIFDSISKGVEQIEVSPAEVGLVVVNLKNILRHDNYWSILNVDEWRSGQSPVFSGYSSVDDAVDAMNQEVSGIEQQIRKDVDPGDLAETFFGKKSIPAIAFYVATAITTVLLSSPIPASLGFIRMFEIGQVRPEDREHLTLVNDGIQYSPRLI